MKILLLLVIMIGCHQGSGEDIPEPKPIDPTCERVLDNPDLAREVCREW